MIYEVKSYSASCDNCGEAFISYHEGWSLFVSENAVHDAMDSENWYTGHSDPEHQEKHYCTLCFTLHPDIDGKIILNETRKKELKPKDPPVPKCGPGDF
jgi:hypothetical protein